MYITLLCPRLSCRAVLQVPETFRGKHVRCGECGLSFVVPEAPASAKPPKSKSPEIAGRQ